MEINVYLFLAFMLALLTIVFLISKLRHVREQLTMIKDALEDICLLYTSDAADE